MKEEMTTRFICFAARVVELGKALNKSFEGRHIYCQLFRSATSSGANYEESHSAESKRDFIHKREISLKELKESLYWIRLIYEAKLISDPTSHLDFLKNENEELIKIISKSTATVKSNEKSK